MADDRTYIKLHDGMPGHPKVRGLSDKAFRTFISALCYCSEYLTDGEVVAAVAKDLGSAKAWNELVDAGLAESAPSGYLMHDYLQHQRSAAQIQDLKEKRREAGRRGGRPPGSRSNPKANANQELKQTPKQNESKNNPETESLTNVRDQAETDSSLCSETSADADAPPRADVQALCEHLRRRVIDNGSRVNITAKWRDAARLLLDRDERSLAEAHALIDWCQESEFWRSNVLSMPTFRQQYDKLRLQAQARPGGLRIATADGERTWSTAELDTILGPDLWRCPQPPRDLDPDQMWEWEQRIKREHRADRIRQAEAKLGRTA